MGKGTDASEWWTPLAKGYKWQWIKQLKRAEAAKAENERLRKALWDIATTLCECGDGSQCKTCYARAALTVEDETTAPASPEPGTGDTPTA